jgi:hypothetical protein
VPNTFAAIAAHGPAALKVVLAADTVVAADGDAIAGRLSRTTLPTNLSTAKSP